MSYNNLTFDEELTEEEKMLHEKFKVLKETRMRVNRHFEKMALGDQKSTAGSTPSSRGKGKEETHGGVKVGTKKEVKLEVKKDVKTPELKKKICINAPKERQSHFKKPVTLQRQLATRLVERNASASSEVEEGEITEGRGYQEISSTKTATLEGENLQPETPSTSGSSSSSGQGSGSNQTSWNKWQRIKYHGDGDSDSD